MKNHPSACEGSHCCPDMVEKETGAGKKHPCPDCSYCQWCGDDRCRLCLPRTGCRKKLSMAEQIAQYEEINRK